MTSNLELRKKAESFLADAHEIRHEELLLNSRMLIHELQVHQIELELQNQELVETRGYLENTRDALTELYNAAPVGFVTIEENGLILKANRTFSNAIGIDPVDLIGRYLVHFVSVEDQDQLHILLRKAANGVALKQEQLHLIRSDGVLYLGELTGLDTPIVNGDVRCFNIAISDVTERERARRELDKMQRLESLGLLAGGIAHDFNNLLLAIFGNVELAALDLPEDHVSREYLDQAMTALENANDLTRQLLTFAKGGTLNKTAVDLPKLLKDAAALSLSGSNVEYDLQCPDHLAWVDADANQLGQVVRNILINARQAMPSGGRIYLTTEEHHVEAESALGLEDGRYIAIAIRDEGCGIPKSTLTKVFDPFFTTKSVGTGLGLAVCYSIVHNHKGAIRIQSAVDEGTLVEVFLPVSQKSPVAARVSSSPPRSLTGKILVMDDEPALRNVMTQMLQRLGFEAATARDGYEAIALFKRAAETAQPFDAVILDLTVTSGLGGESTMTEIRALDPDVVGIVASGYATSPVLSEPGRYMFDGKLDKPFQKDTLGRLLGKLLNKRFK